jgi:hypothetical protein
VVLPFLRQHVKLGTHDGSGQSCTGHGPGGRALTDAEFAGGVQYQPSRQITTQPQQRHGADCSSTPQSGTTRVLHTSGRDRMSQVMDTGFTRRCAWTTIRPDWQA